MTANNGDAPDLDSLVRDHHQALYRYGYRLSGSSSDAEDLTQQTYLIAHQRLEQLRDPSKVRYWLLKILRNVYLRSVKKQKEIPQDGLGEFIEQDDNKQQDVDSEELQLVLNELPEEFRTPLIFYYFRELSYKEVAEVMDCPIGTVMSRLSRGRELLKKKLRARNAQSEQ